MQQVANTLLIHNDQVLMIKKPSKNWYAAPGGKMELGESIKQTAEREFQEETGLTLVQPKLSSVFTFVMKEAEDVEQWMMYTFVAKNYIGELNLQTKEGKLEWIPINDVLGRPMAEGDRFIVEHAISESTDVLTGTFYYTKQFQLIDHIIDRE
ncbi:NUDIX domain-containing protein [Bacillaceae bacterium W0354]